MKDIQLNKRYCPECTKTFSKPFDSSYGVYSYNPVYLVKKIGKYGEFWGCPNFPKCKYRESIIKRKEVFIDYEDELRPY